MDPTRAEAARTLRRGKQTVGLEQLLTTATGDRAVVLVLENMDRVFEAIGLAGQRALRAFVETSGRVAIFGSTPLLSKDFSSRSQPWFGAFDSEFLDDLSVADVTALLARVAREENEPDLAAFVTGTRGQERLRAIAALAGGSPRIWHVLSGCVSVQALDALIPAVRALLEQLTPYYQQRLWELAASEQRVVVELSRQLGSVTVTALAEESGVDRATLANSLKRLAAAGWVTDQKWPGTDQRTTYYDLREPLLRHHLQYREARGGVLDLIVNLLRAFFSSDERDKMLGTDVLGPQAELHLDRSLSRPARSDSPYAERDITKLRAWVRRWTSDPSLPRELVGSATLAAEILTACGSSDPDGVGEALDHLAASATGHDHDLIEVYAACWNGEHYPRRARDRLLAAVTTSEPVDNALQLQIREECAFWTGAAGDLTTARDLFAALVADRTRILGPDHPDTLTTRDKHAFCTGLAGDPATARDLLTALLPDVLRKNGPASLILQAAAGLEVFAARTGKPGLVAEILDSISARVSSELLPAVAPLWVGSALTSGRNLAVASAALGATELASAIAIAGRSQAPNTLVRWIDLIPQENRAGAVLDWVISKRMTDTEAKRLVAVADVDDKELIERVAAARNGDAVARAGLPREIGAILDAQTA